MSIITMLRFSIMFLALASSASAKDFHFKESVGESVLKITVRQPGTETKARELAEWATSSARHILLVYGQFPSDRAQVILSSRTRASWGGNSAVTFGQTTRQSGGTVELFINPERPIEEFYADWTATHEFSHLMLPLLERRHRWISEGFATYYQNLLMARSGNYSVDEAWAKLVAGFERGRQSRPEISPNDSASAWTSGARMKYYWSGAALALLADVELRNRSNGTESLDSVLGNLNECCLPARSIWSGVRLFRRLDSFLDEPVFMPLYEQYADRPGFPAVDSALFDAQNAATRRQIMR